MKKILICILIIGFAFSSAKTQAQYKFGHINLNDIVDLMPEKDSAEADLQKYYKTLLDELEIMQVEYNKKLQEYTTKQATYTDLIKQNKEEELRSLQQRIQQFQQSAEQSYQQKMVELLNVVVEKAKKVIAEVAKENKLFYVFNVGNLGSSVDAVLYHSDESIDITNLVKKKMGLPLTAPVKAGTTTPAGTTPAK